MARKETERTNRTARVADIVMLPSMWLEKEGAIAAIHHALFLITLALGFSLIYNHPLPSHFLLSFLLASFLLTFLHVHDLKESIDWSFPLPPDEIEYDDGALMSYRGLCDLLARNDRRGESRSPVVRTEAEIRIGNRNGTRMCPRFHFDRVGHVSLLRSRGAIRVPIHNIGEGGVCASFPRLAIRDIYISPSPYISISELSDYAFHFECRSTSSNLNSYPRIIRILAGLTPLARWLGHFQLLGGISCPEDHESHPDN